MSRSDNRTGLYWLTQDLRLHDNAALRDASLRHDRLLCVYCLDPSWFTVNAYGSRSLGPHRWRFLKETLQTLETRLAAHGQRLLLCHGLPATALSELIERYRVDEMIRSQSADWYQQEVWRELQQRWPEVSFTERTTHTLFDQRALPFDLADLPATFTQFRKRVESLPVAAPLEAPAQLPPPPAQAMSTPSATLPAAPRDETSRFRGGEAQGLAQLDAYFSDATALRYKQTRNALAGWRNSSRVSAWLANGALSPRLIAARLARYEKEFEANDSTYWLYFELLWREFYQWYAHAHGVRLFLRRGLKIQPPTIAPDPQRFERWCQGATGLPIVDACMRELNATGYMSNRGRQLVASALVNELEQDWRLGAAYFEQQLVDYDVASNWGNWQYLGGVGADPRGRRHFDLEKQAAQHDPDGSFRARWLGEMF